MPARQRVPAPEYPDLVPRPALGYVLVRQAMACDATRAVDYVEQWTGLVRDRDGGNVLLQACRLDDGDVVRSSAAHDTVPYWLVPVLPF